MSDRLRSVGHSTPRLDALKRATGEQRFLSDIALPGSLWAVLVRSPYPRADVKSIDTRAALACKGVVAVFTADEVPDSLFNSAGEGMSENLPATSYRRLLTRSAQHVGDGIAVVVASTQAEAAAAARKVQVKWDVLNPVFDPEEAFARGDILHSISLGDSEIEEAFAAADLVIEGRYHTSAVQHICLEPHCCAASVDPVDGRLTIWSNTQIPAEIRRLCSKILNIPLTRVCVRKITEGGGFGCKQELHTEALIAWLALKLGRPVQLRYSRSEELIASRGRHASVVDVRLEFRSDGTLLGCDMCAILNSGGYVSHAPYVLEDLGAVPSYLYPFAIHRFKGHVVRTNTLPGGAYRGYGAPQAIFPLEQMMDEAAHRLNIDPVELRRRNSPTHERPDPIFGYMGADRVNECLDAGVIAFGWTDALPALGQDGFIHAEGMAVAAMEVHKAASSATVRWNEDGTATLITGTCDSSTGTSTVLAQIVADELGLPLNAISVLEGNTDCGLVDLGSYASRTVYIGGGAACQAAIAAHDRLLDVVALKRKCRRETLAIQDGLIVDNEDAKFRIPVNTFCQECVPSWSLVGAATYAPNDNVPMYSACFVTVAVDPETGVTRVERCVSVIDCGRVLNPLGAAGQVHGGVAQGIGYALIEKWDPGPDGAGPCTIGEHGVPTSLDVPFVQAIFINAPDLTGPYGAKGLGEIPLVPVAPAIANAVARAVKARFTRIPLRPEEIWQALQAHADEPTASSRSLVNETYMLQGGR